MWRPWLTRGSGFATRAAVPLALLVVWEVATRVGWWPRSLVASPSEVAADFAWLLLRGDMVRHSFVSLQRLIFGFGIGSASAIMLGGLIGLSRMAERLLRPTFQLLAPIPPVAWIPLLIIFLGIGELSKVALIALGTFFVVFVNTVQGIRSADKRLVEVAYIFNKTSYELVKSVLFPAALPSVLTGLRVALGLSWILLLAAEVIASSEGLGWLIWDARNFSRPDDMLVGMIAVGILGKFSDHALAVAESWLLRWRPSFQGQ